MPGVSTWLPSSRQHDERPIAHMRHSGTMPRGRHESTGSIATACPTGMSQSAPTSTTVPAISCPTRNGNVQKPASAALAARGYRTGGGRCRRSRRRLRRPAPIHRWAAPVRRPRSRSAPKSGSFRLYSTARMEAASSRGRGGRLSCARRARRGSRARGRGGSPRRRRPRPLAGCSGPRSGRGAPTSGVAGLRPRRRCRRA